MLDKLNLIEDDDLLEKYNTIWDKVIPDIYKKNDDEPVYNKRMLKIKIKFHGDEVTDFHDKEIANVYSNHTCLAVISLDSALKKDENFYLQVILKEYKNIKKAIRHIIDSMALRCGSFSEKTLKKNICPFKIRIIITFPYQIFL